MWTSFWTSLVWNNTTARTFRPYTNPGLFKCPFYCFFKRVHFIVVGKMKAMAYWHYGYVDTKWASNWPTPHHNALILLGNICRYAYLLSTSCSFVSTAIFLRHTFMNYHFYVFLISWVPNWSQVIAGALLGCTIATAGQLFVWTPKVQRKRCSICIAGLEKKFL